MHLFKIHTNFFKIKKHYPIFGIMKVFISSATTGEWMPSFLDINELYTGKSKKLKIHFHQSGVGMLSSTASLTQLCLEEKPCLIIQIGIAGCYNNSIPLKSVFTIKEESLADMGVEEDNKWKDIFDLKLEKSSYFPFEKRKIVNHFLEEFNLLNLKEVSAVTVNQITSTQKRKEQIEKKYNPTLESMEGASLHYVCNKFQIPFIQIRAVSNYVGERDKSKWVLKDALEVLNKTTLQFVDALYKLD